MKKMPWIGLGRPTAMLSTLHGFVSSKLVVSAFWSAAAKVSEALPPLSRLCGRGEEVSYLRKSDSRSRRRRRWHQRQLRQLRIDLRTQFVDVAIAISVQGNVSREVQRRRRHFGRERLLGVLEVVVAVDQDARRFVGNRPIQALD